MLKNWPLPLMLMFQSLWLYGFFTPLMFLIVNTLKWNQGSRLYLKMLWNSLSLDHEQKRKIFGERMKGVHTLYFILYIMYWLMQTWTKKQFPEEKQTFPRCYVGWFIFPWKFRKLTWFLSLEPKKYTNNSEQFFLP